MEPFTTYFLKLQGIFIVNVFKQRMQGGHFDHADRMFDSIPNTWHNCMHGTSDLKVMPYTCEINFVGTHS